MTPGCLFGICFDIIIPPVYEVYRGYIVFVFSVTMFVCVFMCKLLFLTGFSGTTEPRILKFGTNVGYNLLYCVRENQSSPAYHSHYLSIIISSSQIKVSVTDFLASMRA